MFKNNFIRLLRNQNASTFSSASGEHTHVIVGAGSAGCVLANRLTENPNNRVLLLEAGPKDRVLNSLLLSWKIHMPAALTYNLCNSKYNWYYNTTPQKHVNNRIMYWPRGRVWGGSSSLNAMVYIRGHAFDYDRWVSEGAKGWSYDEVLPYFKKAQTHELGEDTYRGGNGPLHVSVGTQENPLFQAFLKAGQEAGYPLTSDMNGFQQEGVGKMDMTVHEGKRWSTASAYLRPALNRPNLHTEVNCLANKVLFDGLNAIGVEYIQSGTVKQVFASSEVILCGGAINSPQLLMLSGLGDADDLKKLDIPTVAHLPGVGQNLQDHLELYVQHKCKKPITLYSAQQPFNMVKIGLEWLTKQTGLGASSHLCAGGFIRSKGGLTHPDIQFHFLPSQVIDHGRKASECHAFQVHVGSLRATSKGWLKLQSRDPNVHPIIEPNYLETESDRWELRESVKLTREIFQQPAFDEFRGEEFQPGKQIQSDDELDAFVREKCDSAYHPSCTCKMGSTDDPMAVVDPQLKVIGVNNLRVVDASVMPSVVSGNLNAPTIMIAEKAADIIEEKEPMCLPNTPVYIPQNVENQR
uniref:Choline dehydrogenase n=1 Tax=Phallusia mammillata TaxID=59560 RepID=A0A6F9D9V5_9ASCI|nr:choline dehydrogenase, mitochondrial [Phallusia mammillata]